MGTLSKASKSKLKLLKSFHASRDNSVKQKKEKVDELRLIDDLEMEDMQKILQSRPLILNPKKDLVEQKKTAADMIRCESKERARQKKLISITGFE